MSEQLDQVRDLHAPVILWHGVECGACWDGGDYSDHVTWPCETAEIVYTPEEVQEVLNGPRPPRPEPRPNLLGAGWFQKVYDEQIQQQLRSAAIFHGVDPDVKGGSVDVHE